MKKLLLAAVVCAAFPVFAQDSSKLLADAHTALKAGDTATAEALFKLAGETNPELVEALAAVHKALDPSPPKYSMAYGQWSPTREGECTKEQHDAYSDIGYGDKLYPTWHPPVEPSNGCFYAHEHGDDPSLSPLYNGKLLFGEINEMAMDAGIHMVHRKEDHVGHKVFVGHGIRFVIPLTGGTVRTTCEILTKLHQGTHSGDATTSNLHEQLNRMGCDDGLEVNVSLLSQIGEGGYLQQQCAPQTKIYVGVPNPADSPTKYSAAQRGRSMGHRFLPTYDCVHVARPNMFEVWKTQNGVLGLDGRLAFGYAWYWGVGDPIRYYDPASPNKIGYNIDACWFSHPTLNQYLVVSNPCVNLRKAGPSISADSTESPFLGVQRSLRPDSMTVKNAGGVLEWFTDSFGLNPSLEKTEKSYVLQQVSTISYPESQINGGGDTISRDFKAPGVHKPN